MWSNFWEKTKKPWKQAPKPTDAAAGCSDEAQRAEQYFADTPLADPKADQFGRLRFASRAAQTIADQRDPSSIVIAISGEYYDDLAQIVEPAIIYEQLLRHDPGLANASYETQLMDFDPVRLQQQFAVTHRRRAGHPAPESK